MTRIASLHARELLDSRGKPTIEVDVRLVSGHLGRAIVPSGASTGAFEAVELRDGGDRFGGDGVQRAIESVCGEIAAALTGFNTENQAGLDLALCEIDGTANKSRLGANAILGVSLAAARAQAKSGGVSLVEHLHQLWRQTGTQPDSSNTTAPGRSLLLPLPMVNMISGGLHAGANLMARSPGSAFHAAGKLDFQDFLVLPVGAKSFRQAVEWAAAIYRRLGTLLSAAGYEGRLVGDEGGFGPSLPGNDAACEILVRAIEAAGLRPAEDVAIGIDAAATHFFKGGAYHLSQGGLTLQPGELADLLVDAVANFPIVSIEDGLAEDDWSGWRDLTGRLGNRVQLIGDDLFATNAARLQQGITEGAANSVLIKLNQIGTLSETLTTMRLAIEAGYQPVVSARSGETEDSFIADLAVATGAGQIKIGSIVRSERLAKYNQLLRLEENLGDAAEYRGGGILRNCRMDDDQATPSAGPGGGSGA